MNLHQLLATNNNCYKSGVKMTPKGIMVHSTGANNPNLKRYVGPDDGLLGVNNYKNYWNQPKPDGKEICCHAFIGKLRDGSVATYQILPWDMKGWNNGGSSNSTHIAFEICEDGLTDKAYFTKVYAEAVDLCVFLCEKYGIPVENIIDHSEGAKKGIASNHGDVAHWFPRFGKSMDTLRADVKAALAKKTEPVKKTMYRVRASWKDAKTQKGAFTVLANAKACADKNPGYKVFDETGKVVYEHVSYTEYTVVHGDTLWKIAAQKLGDGNRYPEIVKLSGLTSNVIYTGQKLKIPKK